MFGKTSAMSLLLLLLVAHLYDHIEGVNDTGSLVSKVRIYTTDKSFVSHMTPGRFYRSKDLANFLIYTFMPNVYKTVYCSSLLR